MKFVKQISHAFRDLFTIVGPAPKKIDPALAPYKFAFLVHPRSYADVARKYPLFGRLPRWVTDAFTLRFWPVVLSVVHGLKSQKSGQEILGYVITVPLTAKQMLDHRELALKRILQACKLAERNGAHIVGLGGLTSSLSKGGLDLVDKVNINITTGHAYTAYNVTENVVALTRDLNINKEKIKIAIVGAAGSVGSTSAKLLARHGYHEFLLVDVERKKEAFVELIKEMHRLNPKAHIVTSYDVKDIKDGDLIVAATNAPEALIKSVYLKPGAIVVDDAQPSDVSPEALDREDILVIEAGVTHTPHIENNFNFGLKSRTDNFCCMAEVLILAAYEWSEHYVTNRATLELVDKIANMSHKLNFKIATYQNRKEVISEAKLATIREIIASGNHSHQHVV